MSAISIQKLKEAIKAKATEAGIELLPGMVINTREDDEGRLVGVNIHVGFVQPISERHANKKIASPRNVAKFKEASLEVDFTVRSYAIEELGEENMVADLVYYTVEELQTARSSMFNGVEVTKFKNCITLYTPNDIRQSEEEELRQSEEEPLHTHSDDTSESRSPRSMSPAVDTVVIGERITKNGNDLYCQQQYALAKRAATPYKVAGTMFALGAAASSVATLALTGVIEFAKLATAAGIVFSNPVTAAAATAVFLVAAIVSFGLGARAVRDAQEKMSYQPI